ncbi:MAG: hypothetical protein WC969_12350 [Elusimicrobiota bacterium]
MLLALCPAAAAFGANPTMSDDFTGIMTWLTKQTAEGLAFNAGSTFDPPNEMKVWRMQPDISFGIGVLPYDKTVFPAMHVQALADKNPGAMLPDKVAFPNLTTHLRLGLPGRMDLGLRLVNVTIPKGYRLSESTKGDGQINTVGVSVRKHFFGGGRPTLSLTGAFNRVYGLFNFRNEFKDVELTPGFIASSVNTGRLEWDVRSYGMNATLSQTYGHWTPFFGMGLNHMVGSVYGHLRADWQTPLISPSYGEASGKPEPYQGRLIFGAQHDGAFPSYFVNCEVKAMGTQAFRGFVLMAGVAAPFRIGAGSAKLSKHNPHALEFERHELALKSSEDREPAGKAVQRSLRSGWVPEKESRSLRLPRVSPESGRRYRAAETPTEEPSVPGQSAPDFFFVR